MDSMIPRSGQIVFVGPAASVQFADDRWLYLQVSQVHGDWVTYDDWLWISGYVLDQSGAATDKRTLFVLHAGLRVVHPAAKSPTGAVVRGNRGRF